MMNLKQQGFTLLEITVTLALSGLLAMGAFSLYEYTNKETKRSGEELTDSISRLTSAAIIQNDLSNSELSFNFINQPDDKGLSFFTLAKNQYCRHQNCTRSYTLKSTSKNALYLIVKKSNLNEVQTLSIHPRSVFNGTRYAGINWQHDSDTHSLSKKKFPLSIWEPKRIMLLSSETDFFDCKISSQSNNANGCRLECTQSGTCDFTVIRPFKFLGAVEQNPGKDLAAISIDGAPNLISKNYQICRPDKSGKCAAIIDANVSSSKNFYEYLPYSPGAEEKTSLNQVYVVKYHIESDSLSTNLIRTVGNYQGSKIVFNQPIKIMSGLDSIVFSRINVSNPVIEYKFITRRNNRNVNKEVRL